VNTLAGDRDLVIRRMRDETDDYKLMVEWRNRPHVRRRWDPDLPTSTLESIREEYRPDTVPGAASTACIVELNERPVGFIQFYRWASYADEASEVGIPFDDRSYGLDVFIGEEDLVGVGIGTRVVTLLSDYLVQEQNASSVSLTTDLDNHIAIRCYEKSGFRKVKQVLDLDTYQGERVWAWLMVKKDKH
jgi:aminoglycoside 6'-N-acetyltransferase